MTTPTPITTTRRPKSVLPYAFLVAALPIASLRPDLLAQAQAINAAAKAKEAGRE